MVLASVAPPSTAGSSAASQRTVQCLVSDLALYPLPANLRLESIDFENLILQHVKNNLYTRSDDRDVVAPAEAASAVDLTRDMMIDDAGEDGGLPLKVEDTGADMTSTTAGQQHRQKPTGNGGGNTRHFVVSLESDRLAWAALKSPLEDGQNSAAVGGFDYSRHCCHYMSTCLSEIKLCYVNIQLPNIIIWLLSSIPKKIVKRETTPMSADGQHQQSTESSQSSKSSKSALFALVLQCFREVDVVSMRQAYKQLRSMQKQTTQQHQQQQQQMLTKKETVDEMAVKKMAATTKGEMQKSSNRSASKESTSTKAGHHILSRQRVPAKLIQEDTTFHLKGTPANSTRATAANSGIQLSQKKNSSPQQMRCNHIRSYLSSATASESEFDTTQISTYLSQKSAQPQLMKSTPPTGSSSAKSARARSRSVESPRHRLRLLYKPIDDIEILIPSAYGRAAEQSGFRRTTLPKSRPSTGTALKGSKQKSAKESSYFTDSLNSEGSSLSDESTSGDFTPNGNSSSSLELDQHYFSKQNHGEPLSPKAACGHPIVIKSALKKSSSYLEGSATAQSAAMANYRPGGYGGLFFRSSQATAAAAAAAASSTRERTKSESRKQASAGGKNSLYCAKSNFAAKKNVTFSAYATIQVVDN